MRSLLGLKCSYFFIDAVKVGIGIVRFGGEVFFYEPGALDLHQRIAAILRY